MSTLSVEDFELVRELVQVNAGVVIEPDKAYLVETRLLPLAYQAGLSSVAALLERLRVEQTSGLTQRVIEAMLNGETLFFRDVPAFDMLKNEIFPRLIHARRERRKLVIWSAACSTGQEPYSIAMLIEQWFPKLREWEVVLLGTDYSEEHLTRARLARYSQFEINRGLPAAQLVRWFEQEGDQWTLRPELRDRVHCSRLNLLCDDPPASSVDLVLLRNVMIYWSVATKRSVLEKIRGVLPEDGVLVLGAAESTFQIHEDFERFPVGNASYYRASPKGMPRPARAHGSSRPPFA